MYTDPVHALDEVFSKNPTHSQLGTLPREPSTSSENELLRLEGDRNFSPTDENPSTLGIRK